MENATTCTSAWIRLPRPVLCLRLEYLKLRDRELRADIRNMGGESCPDKRTLHIYEGKLRSVLAEIAIIRQKLGLTLHTP